jgi:hypothetical protein
MRVLTPMFLLNTLAYKLLRVYQFLRNTVDTLLQLYQPAHVVTPEHTWYTDRVLAVKRKPSVVAHMGNSCSSGGRPNLQLVYFFVH